MKWIARSILAALAVALCLPFWLPQISLWDGPDSPTVPVGVLVLALLACSVVGLAIVYGLLWLLVTAGIVKGDR